MQTQIIVNAAVPQTAYGRFSLMCDLDALPPIGTKLRHSVWSDEREVIDVITDIENAVVIIYLKEETFKAELELKECAKHYAAYDWGVSPPKLLN